MATQDVRLTATNPEDSSVVPVACNEKGELKLEEPLVVEGPPGQQGEPGPKGDDGRDGDPFTGNFADDVTFGGSASFTGVVDVGNTLKVINESNSATAKLAIIGNVENSTNYGKYVFTPQRFWIGPDVTEAPQAKIEFDVNNGSAKFAGGKAGFTKEGGLWITDERGDRWRTTFGSNNFMQWEKIVDLRDELKDAWAEKNVLRPKPEDSSQDEPETRQ